MPPIVFEILLMIAQFFRFIGMAILGLGMGWLTLDLLKKMQVWQAQVAVYLGLVGLIIALAVFTSAGALGAFAIGAGISIFMWGMPRAQKKEEETD
jgi:hypothetical protein